MKLTKNKLLPNQLKNLSQAIDSFAEDQGYSGVQRYHVYRSALRNIDIGLQKQAVHDLWMTEDVSLYCLCREERDIDGQKVYTAYQLWIDPKRRSLALVRRFTRFLRFYTQKQGYKGLCVISSRLDRIKAYSRGLGKGFKVTNVVFMNEF